MRAAARMRRLRARRKAGLAVVVALPLTGAEVTALERLGLISGAERADRAALRRALGEWLDRTGLAAAG